MDDFFPIVTADGAVSPDGSAVFLQPTPMRTTVTAWLLPSPVAILFKDCPDKSTKLPWSTPGKLLVLTGLPYFYNQLK